MRMAAAVAALALVFLLGGAYGSYAYLHDYDLYRGFPAPSEPAGIARGTLVQHSFYSPALREQRSCYVYLPPGYPAAAAAGRRFPVLYLLHAPVGHARNYIQVGGLAVRMDTLLARHRIRPFIVAIPEAHSPFGTDHEWANSPGGAYESFVLDTVRAVDARFATKPTRANRMLAGLSAGGYGATNITLHHPAVFGSFESWSGYFTQTPTDAFKGASAALLHANDPDLYLATVAPELRRHPLRALLYQGYQDDVPPADMVAFARRLEATGSQVSWALYGGGHDWRLWRAHFSRMLEFASRTFEAGP
jgi:enterochelin esterase-like enzyme